MPVMDGFEATRQIRSIEKERGFSRLTARPSTPTIVVALTGLASSRDEEKAYANGVNIFITKPVQFKKLEHLLKQYEDGVLLRSSYCVV
jgi:CheY-like chemotaxis protein